MAHTKSGGKTVQKRNRPGRRLGVKVFGGQKVKSGAVIVRQRGSNFHPGEGAAMGRDFTLFALKEGIVVYKKKQGEKIISVVNNG